MSTDPSQGQPPAQQTQQPTSPEPVTPPPTPAAPAPPPAHTPSATDAFGALQASVDGLSEKFITGMKEAFPVLSQPPQQPSQAQAQQVDQATGQQPNVQSAPPAKKAEGRQPTRLARAWFGR